MRPQPYRPDGTRMLFLDYATGKGCLDTGAPLPMTYAPQRRTKRLGLEAILETARAAGVRRVLLTGPRPPERWLEGHLPAGWRPDPAGHYVDADDPTGRWVGPTAEDRVEVRRAAAWLGDGDYTPTQAREAFALLVSGLRTVGKGQVGLMASPAATGQSLWAASLPPEWGAQLDEETAAITRKTSPQHRMEVLGRCYGDCPDHLPPPPGKLQEVHYLDGRLMYLACTRARAGAPAKQLKAHQAQTLLATREHARARLFGSYRVPPRWDGPGLLMEPHPDGTHWHAPNRPGYLGWTWADSLEWWEAERQGWAVEVTGGWELTGPPVLETWTARMLKLREIVTTADADDTTRQLAAAAVRMVALTTIGAFHSTGRERTIVADGPAAIPDGVRDWQTREDGTVVYRLPNVLTGNAAAFAHPELSSQVWALARWRVTQAMASVPRASLVGVWGDAVYLDHLPTWALPTEDGGADDGKVGRLRPKGHLDGPVARPANMAGLQKLRERMVA